MEKLKVVGWDNGYDFEKLVVGEEKGDRILFPSVIDKPSEMVDLTPYSNGDGKEKMVVEYDGEIFVVGDFAIHNAPQGGIKNYERDKFKNKSEEAKFLAGINLLTDDEEVMIKKLVVGLPIGIYNDLKEDLKRSFEDTVFRYTAEKNNKKIAKMVTIQDVMVIPQGVGGFYNSTLSFNGKIKKSELLDKRYGLVDIGGNTVDMFVGERLKPANNSQIQLPAGVSDAFKSIDNDSYILIEQAFIEGKDEFTYGGKTYRDIKKDCNKEFKRLADKIYMNIRDQWNRHIDRIEVFILIGGGAKVLGEYLEDMMVNRLNKNAITVDNPIFANALGYYKLGVYQTEREKTDAS